MKLPSNGETQPHWVISSYQKNQILNQHENCIQSYNQLILHFIALEMTLQLLSVALACNNVPLKF